MSSSIGALTRSRSLRKPVINNNNTNNNTNVDSSVIDGANIRDGPRALSPTRLPIKGSLPTIKSTSKSGASGMSSTSTRTVTSSAVKRTRPLSAIIGRSAPASKEETTSSDVLNSRSPRTASTRVPITGTGTGTGTSSSGPLTRSGSMARPTTSSGLPGSITPRSVRAPSGHARTKSSITSLTSATTLRPPSQTSGDSSSSTTTVQVTDRSRPPITTRSVTHRRNISNSSAVITASTSTTTSRLSKPSSSGIAATRQPSSRQPAPPIATIETRTDHPRERATTLGGAINPHRPVFSTLQQHYSPAKSLAPKPLTSTFLEPPSPSKLPSNIALSAEVSRLQSELLQLHLLHRDAQTVSDEWHKSAKGKLGEKFSETVKMEKQVRKLEEEVIERGNLRGLVEWGGKGGELEGKIQMLDEVISGAWGVGEPGGRYERLVRRFEKWMGRVREVSVARGAFDDGEKVGAEGLLMGEGEREILGDDWRGECAVLVRRLEEWRRMVGGMVDDDGDGESSLGRILKGCRGLVGDMLEELKLMEVMEREAVAVENAWVRGVNRDEGEGAREGGGDARAGAIWRAF